MPLKGNQKKLIKIKNRIDAQDFKILKAEKKRQRSWVYKMKR